MRRGTDRPVDRRSRRTRGPRRALRQLVEGAGSLWRGEWIAAREKEQRRPPQAFAPVLRSRGVYILLAAVLAIATAAALLYREAFMVQQFAPNVATELLGIIVTLAFVQRFLERQERARRLRGSIGALRKAAVALSRMVDAWAALVKGSLSRPPDPLPDSLFEVFSPDITEDLINCDPARERAGAGEGHWVAWTVERVQSAQRSLRELVSAYGGTLDPVYLEAIDELADDPFPAFLAGLLDADAREWRLRVNGARGMRVAHFSRLLDALHLHNEFAREAARLRRRGSAPRTATVGITLSADADLRIPGKLDESWWGTMPRPGTVCVARGRPGERPA